MGFLLVASFLAAVYFLLQLYYLIHWRKTETIRVPAAYVPDKSFSVIVVARNASGSIGDTIENILRQNYPDGLFELIVIDDHSTDQTSEVVERFQHPFLRSFRLSAFPAFIHPPAYKKSGIALGVHQAKFDHICVTDADCMTPREWLRTIAYALDMHPVVFLSGPISLEGPAIPLVKMQQMENHALMLITCAGIRSGLHDIANGANMAFLKKAFHDVKGYEGNYAYASGDDVFLIEKMRAKFPHQIAFLKSTGGIVSTGAKTNWTSLIRQRLRWQKKNEALDNPLIGAIWMFVGLYHVLMVAFAIAGVAFPRLLYSFLTLLVIKWVADYVIIRSASGFFNKPVWFRDFMLCQVLYSSYVVRLGWNLLLKRKGDWGR